MALPSFVRDILGLEEPQAPADPRRKEAPPFVPPGLAIRTKRRPDVVPDIPGGPLEDIPNR